MISRLNEPMFFVGCDIRNLDYLPGQNDPYIGSVVDWPAHITLIPPVRERTDELPEDIFEAFRAIGSRTTPITVASLRDAQFGKNGEVLVTIVEDLKVLHFALIGILHSYGYDGRYPDEFTGRRFNAHTSRTSDALPPSSTIALNSMSIFRRRNGHQYIQERIAFSRTE